MPRTAGKVIISGISLDVLHMTRLKLACSLLLSEGIEAEFSELKHQRTALLVVDEDNAESAAHIRVAHQKSIPVLAFSRRPGQSNVASLGRNATVHDITGAMAKLLVNHSQQEVVDVPLPTLLNLLRLDQRDDSLLLIEYQEKRLVIDKQLSAIYLADQISEAWLEQQLGSPWKSTTLSAAEKQFLLQQGSWHVASLEAFICKMMTGQKVQAPRLQDNLRIALKAWPDMDLKNIETEWLVPLTYLLTQSWTAQQLQQMVGIGHDSLARMLLSIQLCGLAANEEVMAKPRKKASLADSRVFGWVARRFGARVVGG